MGALGPFEHPTAMICLKKILDMYYACGCTQYAIAVLLYLLYYAGIFVSNPDMLLILKNLHTFRTKEDAETGASFQGVDNKME